MLFQTSADAVDKNHLKVSFSLSLNVSASCPALGGCSAFLTAEIVSMSNSSSFAFPTTAHLNKPPPL